MTGTLKAGFLPIDLFFENSILPDLSLVQGDAGLRGYAARFFSADGVLMEKGAGQSARLYAANPDDKKAAYYLEGTYTDGVWLLEVPTEAISKAGRVLLQVALYEGETALIQSRASLVEVPLSIAQGGVSGHSVRVDFDRVDALLKEARTAMDEADRRSKVAEDYANRGNADLARLEGGEEERRKAEADRKADFEALKDEGARTLTSLNQTNAQYQALTASADAEEAARKQAELERARAEAERATNENKRQTQEQDRTNAEGKREASEGARKTQEDARSQSEAQRKNAEAERERKETERKSAETERKGAEAEREASEGIRKAQEGERVEAEKSRKATFESWNKTMDGVIPLAEEAAPGIVKVKKAAGEEKPYTVPTVGVLTEKADKAHTHQPSDIEGLSQALEAAGRVKSVNGKTGDVVLSPATQSADGLFSMSDKAKLDGVEAGANRYIHPATHKIQEIDGLGRALGQKADAGHTHDDKYYTIAETDEAFNEVNRDLDKKADIGHTHDDRYYTEYEVDSKLDAKASVSHTHSAYLTISQAGKVYQPKSAMALYATKEDLEKMGGSSYIYQLAEFDTTAGVEALKALRDKKRIEEAVLDPTAMTAVLNSSAAMTAVANSFTAMTAVANSSTAMEAVANSSTAMEAVANSSAAMEAVANSSTAMTAVANSSTAMEALWDKRERLEGGGKSRSGLMIVLEISSKNGSGVSTLRDGSQPSLRGYYEKFAYFRKFKQPSTFICNDTGGPYWIDYFKIK